MEALVAYFEHALEHLSGQVSRFPAVLEQQLQLQQVGLSGQLFEYQAALQAVQEDARLHNERCEQLRNQLDTMENKLEEQRAAARRERAQMQAQADAKEARATMLQHELDDTRRQCSIHQLEEAALQDRLFSLQSEKTDLLLLSESTRSAEMDQIRSLLSTASERESSLLHELSTVQMERFVAANVVVHNICFDPVSVYAAARLKCGSNKVRLLSASKVRVLDLCSTETIAETTQYFDDSIAPSTSQLLDAATKDFEQICELLNQYECL